EPPGSTVTFDPDTVDVGGSSTMHVHIGDLTPPGDYGMQIGAHGPVTSQISGIELNVEPSSDFSLSAAPDDLTLDQGGSAAAALATAVAQGAAQPVDLPVKGAPSNATLTFDPASIEAGDPSTLGIQLAPDTDYGTYTVTVTATAPHVTRTATVSLTVKPPAD